MSTLGPNLVGSILQIPLAQHQASSLRDTERAHSVNAQRRQVAAIAETDSSVETTDTDTQVHTDSEGQGSQGRAFSEAQEEQQPAPDAANPDEGHVIDLEA